MIDYYKTNAIYEYLDIHNHGDFAYAKGNLWMLLYGNELSEPKIFICVSAVNECDYNANNISEHEKEIFQISSEMSKKAGLPFGIVRFNCDRDTIDRIKYFDCDCKKIYEMDIQRLKNLFKKNGITVTPDGKAHKYVNDKTSSAFHKWQRESLGSNIVVCDLDLLHMKNTNMDVDAIYELKRSYKSLDEWNPYDREPDIDDLPNFKMVGRFADKLGIVLL